MDESRREEVQELMEEVAKELGYEWENRENTRRADSSQKPSRKRSWTPIIVLVGAIIVLSLVIQWAARSRISTQYESLVEELSAVKGRLAALESKIQRSADIDARINKLESQIGGLETSISSISKRIDKLSAQSRAGKPKKTSSSLKRNRVKTYIIRRGDTLFGIAKKFGVSAASICKANGLSLKSVLHPGQKLTIPAK